MGENLEASIPCTLHLSQIGVRSIRSKAVTEDQAAILRLVGADDRAGKDLNAVENASALPG
jgi:Trk K+ transport system NAD-binding subunit